MNSHSLTMPGCMENSVDPDQLASSADYIWPHTVFKEFMHGISKVS